ncbi:hypothetical protein ACFYZB_46470 [Streptomyces sp. NPDC001852]|uniref:hypothetical protein n=1 Tax=Streptomyces sp. NPDC001852 TaxID=3364619 RepID=UPI0036A3DF11
MRATGCSPSWPAPSPHQAGAPSSTTPPRPSQRSCGPGRCGNCPAWARRQRRRNLLAEASGGRVTLHTSAPPRAAQVLHGAGATVLATGPDTLGVTGLPDEEIVALLTRDAVEYRGIPVGEATP